MFERYTEQARRAIFFARYEASFQPAAEITTGHILVGIMREADSRSVALGLLKDREPDIRSALGIPSPNGKERIDLKRDIPLDQKAKKVLAYAAKEAEFDDSFYIYIDHLLRGVLCFPNEAAGVLQSISIDLAKVREASKLSRKEYPVKKTLYHRLFGSPFETHRILLLKWLTFLAVLIFGSLLIRWLN